MIEAVAYLRVSGRSQIDGDASGGELKTAVHKRAAHPLLAFAYGGFGETDDG